MAVRAVMVWVKKGLGIDHLKLISVGPGLGLGPSLPACIAFCGYFLPKHVKNSHKELIIRLLIAPHPPQGATP